MPMISQSPDEARRDRDLEDIERRAVGVLLQALGGAARPELSIEAAALLLRHVSRERWRAARQDQH